jgi:hypothetical protein
MASMSADGTKGEKEILSHRGKQLICMNNDFLPILLQVCKIAPGQRCKKLNDKLVSAMIKKTACPPVRREDKIRKIVSKAGFSSDSYLHEFGITVDPNMCELEGRVLPPPELQYGQGVVTPDKGDLAFEIVGYL